MAARSEPNGSTIMTTLSGKTALVTGASRGIGRASALALAKAGAQVLVHYSRGAAEANRVVNEIRAGGGRADAVAADLAIADGPHKLAAQVRRIVGDRLDILVVDAGVSKAATIGLAAKPATCATALVIRAAPSTGRPADLHDGDSGRSAVRPTPPPPRPARESHKTSGATADQGAGESSPSPISIVARRPIWSERSPNPSSTATTTMG